MLDEFNHALARGLHLERTGAAQEALADLQAGLRIDPNSVLGLLALSRALANLQRFDEAVEPARRVTHLDPANVRGHVQLGTILYNKGAYAGAWESHQRALELDSSDAQANHLGSFTLDRLGRSGDAAVLAARALDADPMNADIHLHLGNLLVNARDDAAAEQAYRRALDIGAPRLRTLVLLAPVLARQQKLKEALDVAREAAALAPDDKSIAALCRDLSAVSIPGAPPPVETAHTAVSAQQGTLFAINEVSGRVVLFAPLLPPAQLPLLNEASMPHEAIAEHYEYAMPPQVAVYSLSGFRLCGVGLFRRDEEVFYGADVLPPYFRSHLRAGGQPLPDAWAGTFNRPDVPVRRLDTPCFCPFHPNLVYGHFLLEMLPKLYLWHFLKECGAVYPVLVPTSLPPWARQFLNLFVNSSHLRFYDPDREAVEAPYFVLASMMHTDHNFHPAFNLALDHAVRSSIAMTEPAKQICHGKSGQRRLYLSRRRATTAWHCIVNEEEVESLFADLGFEILHPQELSISEQIRAFAKADVVAGEFSSALHNTAFSPAGTRVIALNRINWYQSRIGRLKRQPIAYVAPADGIWRDWRARNDRADFAMDCAQVRGVVMQVLENVSTAADV